MLVLTRKTGETLMLGDSVEVRVLRVDGDEVRLGIVAPRSVSIVRGELLADIRAETQSAAGAALSQLENLKRELAGRHAPQSQRRTPDQQKMTVPCG